MRMLRKMFRILLILHSFITFVLNEDLNEAGNEQLSQDTARIQNLSEESTYNRYKSEADPSPHKVKDSKLNQSTEEDAENQHITEELTSNVTELKLSNKVQNVVSEETNLKLKNKLKPVLWKLNDALDKKLEPGFDLTSDEMQKFKIWKDGVIPYYIDVISFSDKVLRDKIRNYLHMVNGITSLIFVELPNPPSNGDERWVFFINRRGLLGCADHIVKNFTNQGVQQVVLGYDCISTKGELAEAVMSIAGVPAQHNAPDRDKYITVNTENIIPEKIGLFEKLHDNEWLFHDLEYDLDSVTHYDIHKHSANGRVTIQLKKESDDINPAKALSSIDILKIKMLYNYITRNKKLQVPDCQKLFKPRNNFEDFVPNHKPIKPRKKPSKYLGLYAEEEEYQESTRQENKEGEQRGQSQRDINPNEEEDEEWTEENHDVKNQDGGASHGSPFMGQKKRVISKIDALALLSDYNSN